MIKNEQQLQFGYVKGTSSSIQNNRILENVKSVDHIFCISLYFWVLLSKLNAIQFQIQFQVPDSAPDSVPDSIN